MGTTSNRDYRYPESTDNTEIWTHIKNLADDVDSDVTDTWAADWTDYSSSFALTGSTTSPTKGSGSTYGARYRYTGATSILYTGRLQLGSGFTAGTGTVLLSVPVAASDSVAFGACGHWWALDSTHAIYTGTAIFSDASHLQLYRNADTAAVTFATFTWSSGDELRWSIEYEVDAS